MFCLFSWEMKAGYIGIFSHYILIKKTVRKMRLKRNNWPKVTKWSLWLNGNFNLHFYRSNPIRSQLAFHWTIHKTGLHIKATLPCFLNSVYLEFSLVKSAGWYLKCWMAHIYEHYYSWLLFCNWKVLLINPIVQGHCKTKWNRNNSVLTCMCPVKYKWGM